MGKSADFYVNRDGISAEVPIAPARGPIAPFHDVRVVAVGTDGFDAVPERYPRGAPARAKDVFDQMIAQSKRQSGGAPLTPAQIAAGREYGAVHERVQSSGLACSSAFDVSASGGGQVDFMDAYMIDAQRLAWFHKAIGDAVAKDIKRRVPARAGSVIVGEAQLRAIGRRLITVRELVDRVCLSDQSLSAVLKHHGWRPTGKNRLTLRATLSAALERMQGI